MNSKVVDLNTNTDLNEENMPAGWHKHPFIVPIITFFILFFVSCAGFIYFSGETIGASDAKVINLHVDGKSQTVPTRAETVGEFLHRTGVELKPEDVVEPILNSPIEADNFTVKVYRARLVTVTDEDGKKITAKIAESDPKSVAKKAGMKVYPEDKVAVAPPGDALRDGVIGEMIDIDRATPTVVNLYGNSLTVRTHAKTVGELLKEKNIKPVEGDTVQPSLDTKLGKNAQVFVVRFGKQIVTVEEPIAPPVENRQDATMDMGKSKVIEPGAPGKKIVTYEIEMKNGKETGRKEIQSVIAAEPQKRIQIVGAKKNNFSGGFEAALARLRSCEGSYTSNTGNGYYGAYQFNQGSWNANAPADYVGKLPSSAPPGVQDLAASTYYRKAGWRPWPGCTTKLGLQDIYR